MPFSRVAITTLSPALIWRRSCLSIQDIGLFVDIYLQELRDYYLFCDIISLKVDSDTYSAWGKVSAHSFLCSDRHPMKHE